MDNVDPVSTLYNTGIRALARREHGVEEMRRKLERKARSTRLVGSDARRRDGSVLDPSETITDPTSAGQDKVGQDKKEQVAAAMERLQQQDFLSDKRFVVGVIRSRINRGYGPHYIRRELKSKGVSADLVEEQLARYQEEHDVDWFASAANLVERRFEAASHDPKVWAKGARYLQRRGFSGDVVHEAIGPQPRTRI